MAVKQFYDTSILNTFTHSHIFIGTNNDFIDERKTILKEGIEKLEASIGSKIIFDIDLNSLKDGNMAGDYSLISVHNPNQEMFEVFIANSLLVNDFVNGFLVYRNPETNKMLCYPADNINPEESDFAHYYIVLKPSLINTINKTRASARGKGPIVICDDLDPKKGATFNLMGSQSTISKSKLVGNIKQKKVGRNEPCYCGSGRKFKHCHNG